MSPRKCFTSHDERWILRQVKDNPKISAPKLTEDIQKCLNKVVNPQTVRNVLKKYNYWGRIARRKPFVNKRNRKVRLNYCKEYSNHYFDYWKDVLFTDESKFNIFGSDGMAKTKYRTTKQVFTCDRDTWRRVGYGVGVCISGWRW